MNYIITLGPWEGMNSLINVPSLNYDMTSAM